MAHFAEIDENNIVRRVLVVHNDEEHRGAQFLAVDLLLGGTWIQCSYTGRIRKQYPGVGYRYDPQADVFIAPQPFPSWTLDSNYDWRPPIPMPTDGAYLWDESTTSWKAIEQ